MKDETIERVWRSREAISRACGFDSRRLVRCLQGRFKAREAARRRPPDAPAPGCNPQA